MARAETELRPDCLLAGRSAPGDRETLVSLFFRRVRQSGDQEALLTCGPDGAWRRLTWKQIAGDAAQAAAALVACGVRPGDRVVQLSENRYEWIVADLAIHLARGVHVALHSSLSGPQVAEQICDCGARLALASTAEQARKITGGAGTAPSGLRVLSYEDCTRDGQGDNVPGVGRWSDILAEARLPDGDALGRDALATMTADDLATILYTSGTTGEPKGVMLSHGNLASNALASLEAFESAADDLRLCWLPLSHIFARTADLYVWIACGCRLALARSREQIIADCGELHPTTMNGVPYFFDKVFRWLQAAGRADDPGSLQEVLGGRMRCCVSGGAPLSDQVAEFFARQGVPLVQGYGMTESSPVITTGSPSRNRIGTVGPPVPGVEVRLASDGEVLTRGPHVMLGYWQKPAATSEAIVDGWLHTGDLGRMDDGYLRITGRKKELIVTAAGKNIAPTYLEGLLTDDPLISQAIVLGDRCNYLTALIVPDRAALEAELATLGVAPPDAAELCRSEVVNNIYASRIAERLRDVSRIEQIQKFRLLERPFSIEAGELTPTLKLRRSTIAEHFAGEIAAMYC